jgi:hypothetical protein
VARDFVIAAQGVESSRQTAREMLEYSLATFQRSRSVRDLKTAQMVARQFGRPPPPASP